MKRAREMERRTGEPSSLPTHRTFKTSNNVHFHSSRTGKIEEKKEHSRVHTLRCVHPSTHTFTSAHAAGKDSLSEYMDQHNHVGGF